MVVFNGSHYRSSAQTTYGFEPSHVFAIHDPVEVLYECVGFNGTDLIARPVETPVLQQSFGQDELRRLVAEGKIEPRTRENEEHNKPRIANAPQKLAAVDLPEDEKAELLFYYELCYRIMRMREDGETSLSEGPLRLAIAQVWAQLVSGVSEAEPDRKHSRPGRRPKFKLPKEHKIGARKEKVSFGVPAPSTVKGWIRALNENQWDLLALRDHRKGRVASRSPRISDPKATALMHSWVREYLDSSRPTMATLYKLMRGSVELEEENARREKDGKLPLRPKDIPSFAAVNVQRAEEGLPSLAVPSQSTFERAIRKLGKYEVMAAREGPGKARRKFRVVGRSNTTLLPGQRVLLDCWKVQLMGLKLPHEFWDGLKEDLAGKLAAVRLTLCVAIDEATRVILGARLSVNANAETAFRTLEMVCQDKTEIARAADCRSDWAHACTPRTVAVDSGSEFIDARVKCAVGDIGSSYDVGRAKHPDARGVVERFFETMDSQQLQFFQGRTFSGISDKGDYDPAAVANVLAEDLGKHLVRYIVDTYHNTSHSGLSWQTPNEAWEDLSSRYVVKPPPGGSEGSWFSVSATTGASRTAAFGSWDCFIVPPSFPGFGWTLDRTMFECVLILRISAQSSFLKTSRMLRGFVFLAILNS